MSSPARAPRRRWVRRLLLLGALGWLVVAGAMVLLAKREADAGQDAAKRAEDRSSPEDLVDGRPLPDLRSARSHLLSARARLRNPLVAPLRVLPVVGRQIRAVDGIAEGSATVLTVGIDAVIDAQAVLAAPDESGPQRVEVMRRLADVATRTDSRLEGIGFGTDEALIGPVRDARDEVTSRLDQVRSGLRKGAAGARAGADLLAGPRRYLVLAANNAEMRAGSGMFLSAGVLETRDGHIEVSPFESTSELILPPEAVPLEGDLAARWGFAHPNQDWRNLAVSPRFDVTAPLAARMWAAAGKGPVDGVVAVDPDALRAVLEATGSVEVDGRRLTDENIVDHVLNGQYVQHAREEGQSARREDLGQVARAVVRQLEDADWSPSRMARTLGGAARGRHVLAWSSRPEEQQAWRDAAVDGGLAPDDVLAAVLNRGANKLDYFLDVDASLDVADAGDRDDATLTLTLRNQVPPDQPPYVAGDPAETGVSPGTYSGFVAVSLPGSAAGATIEGYPLVAAGPDGPTEVAAAAVEVAPGEERRVVVRFSLPSGLRSVRVQPSARVGPVRWSFRDERWPDATAHRLRW